jgi:uncharacterized metal-binding protein
MPSGKVHDAITVALALPAFGITYIVTGSLLASLLCGAAFVFGGLMFGPDLDTVSKPYARWGPARIFWFPYRHFISHRSRLSHGLLLGALIRVVYALGILTIILMIAAFVYQGLVGGRLPEARDIGRFWTPVGKRLGTDLMVLIFIGLWAGAASHTLTDLAGSFVKTGRRGKFF